MSEVRAREIMSVYLSDVVGNGQIDLIDNFTAPTFWDHTQTELKGPEALRAHVETFRSNIKHLKVEVVGISASNVAAFGIWRWEGEPIDDIWGRTSQDEMIVPRLIGSLFHIENEMLVEYQPFLDAMDMLGQVS